MKKSEKRNQLNECNGKKHRIPDQTQLLKDIQKICLIESWKMNRRKREKFYSKKKTRQNK